MSTLLTAQSLRVDTAFGTLFDSLSFTLKKGDRIGLLGDNGCGKSTLLKVLDGTDSPAAGTVALAGHCLMARVEQHLPDAIFPLTMLDAVLAPSAIACAGKPKRCWQAWASRLRIWRCNPPR